MSLIVLSDVILANNRISQNVTGRVRRKNKRVPTINGYVSANVVWDRSLRQYEFGTVPMLRADWQQLESIFEVTEGGAYGFLLLDPKDSTVTTAEGRVAAVSDAPGFVQLFKRYTEPVSGRYKDRKITRPVVINAASSVFVYVNGVNTTYVMDETNGRVQITGNPDPSTVTWEGRFYVPVHFEGDDLEWTLVLGGANTDARFFAGPTVVLDEIREGLPV